MISHLRGTVCRLHPGEADVEVNGVGYRVTLPISAWDDLKDGAETTLWITTYVREDRLELYGFLDRESRTLFEALIARQGIGPRLGLELCALPRGQLLQAAQSRDAVLLSTVKGVGRKTAEKLLVELGSVLEQHPEVFTPRRGERRPGTLDTDALAALTQLGYSTAEGLAALKDIPKDLKTTEERVTAALRSL